MTVRFLTLSVVILIAACGSPPPPSAEEPAPATAIQAAADDLAMSVVLDRTEVASGGIVHVTATIENDRPEAVTHALQPCNLPVRFVVTNAVPLEPAGREWPGIAGEFKRYVLEEGYGPGGVPARGPFARDVHPAACPVQAGHEGSIGPGRSVAVSYDWSAETVAGIGAVPGLVPFTVSFAYDPQPPGAAAARVAGHGTALQAIQYKELVVNGRITVVGPAPRVLSAGEAVDALLSDASFAQWLEQRPSTTWSVANAYLISEPVANGQVPAGPTWAVELFREIGVPRHWAIAYIDPITGGIRSLRYCHVPCDR